MIVEFGIPLSPERQRLWNAAIPEQVPGRANLKFDELAQSFEFTGGKFVQSRLGDDLFIPGDLGRIARVAYQACAEAALRSNGEREV